MRITNDQVTMHRRRVEKILVERRQGGMAEARLEGWSDEFESAHARHLVVELPDVGTEARGEAPAARGLPTGDMADVVNPGAVHVSPVDCEG